MAQFCSRFMGRPGDALFTCGAGRAGAVDAYGRYQPCMLLRDPALTCDVRGPGGLAEALGAIPARLQASRPRNPDYLARCARCFLAGLCGQCPAQSWMEHGTLDTPVAYLCQAAHAEARALGLLTDGERAWEVADLADWRARVKNLAEGGA
jgi:radical SAM protein with 4Fe4S-binding SPASM domain